MTHQEYTVGERAVVLEYLDHYRAALQRKCEDLDAEQMARRSVPPSTLSLLGLVRHMAKVEHIWFRECIGDGSTDTRPFWSADVKDVDFDEALAEQALVDEAWEVWDREVAHARAVAEDVDLDAVVTHHGEPAEVRDVLVHMVEEYARHLGHADLLRECIDGRTGE
jgi:uncharacterized damage-inducible protein DinB